MVSKDVIAPAAAPARIKIGKILINAVRVYFSNFLWMTLIMAGALVIANGMREGFAELFRTCCATKQTGVAEYIVTSIVFALIYMIAYSMLICGTLRHMREGRVRAKEALRCGIARAPVMILTGVLLSVVLFVLAAVLTIAGTAIGLTVSAHIFPISPFASVEVIMAKAPAALFPIEIAATIAIYLFHLPFISLGTLLANDSRAILPIVIALVIANIPVFYLTAVWTASVVACVAERLSPIRAMGRARKLSKGSRWRIAVLVMACILLIVLPSTVDINNMINGVNISVSSAINYVIMTLAYAFAAVVCAVTFVELRRAEETTFSRAAVGHFLD